MILFLADVLPCKGYEFLFEFEQHLDNTSTTPRQHLDNTSTNRDAEIAQRINLSAQQRNTWH
jgi:hypothetical protein